MGRRCDRFFMRFVSLFLDLVVWDFMIVGVLLVLCMDLVSVILVDFVGFFGCFL